MLLGSICGMGGCLRLQDKLTEVWEYTDSGLFCLGGGKSPHIECRMPVG